MQKHRHFLPCAVAAAVIATGLISCKPEATDEAMKAKEWLVTYYKNNAIRGGWAFFGATAKDSDITVVINVPQQQGKELGMLHEEDRDRLIRSNVCPAKIEDVWTILEQSGDIIIDARSSGNVVATVSCKKVTLQEGTEQ